MTLSAIDKLEIQELVARAYRGLDQHEPESWAECFTPDGVFNARYGNFRGRAEIAGFIRSHIEKGNEDGSRHCVTNFIVEETNGVAVIYGYVMKFRIDKIPATIAGTALLTGSVAKTPQGWLLGRLELGIQHTRIVPGETA